MHSVDFRTSKQNFYRKLFLMGEGHSRSTAGTMAPAPLHWSASIIDAPQARSATARLAKKDALAVVRQTHPTAIKPTVSTGYAPSFCYARLGFTVPLTNVYIQETLAQY
jgi:hypothetical protein